MLISEIEREKELSVLIYLLVCIDTIWTISSLNNKLIQQSKESAFDTIVYTLFNIIQHCNTIVNLLLFVL